MNEKILALTQLSKIGGRYAALDFEAILNKGCEGFNFMETVGRGLCETADQAKGHLIKGEDIHASVLFKLINLISQNKIIISKLIELGRLELSLLSGDFWCCESRPPRKNYNQLSSNEKLDHQDQKRQDIHIEDADVDSDASSTDLDERDTRGVCPPCAHDRYNNNVRCHDHDELSDDSDYGESILLL
ncbi:unnamed protein product [Leptidea sinapis]|uniref:Uncharacterized protein n=1 Tax=Leptidea sinapis TaxID=189913 RepID=A0A5E4R025_9NEOP|nr:unnamed protein product [Leptidea sinapis]